MSLTLTGSVKQVRFEQRGHHEHHSIVVETDDTDRYGRPIIQEVRLSKNQVQNGYVPQLDKFVGKAVRLPVWVNAWAGRAGASYTLFLQDCDLNTIKAS
jgi:hypothetical protein